MRDATATSRESDRPPVMHDASVPGRPPCHEADAAASRTTPAREGQSPARRTGRRWRRAVFVLLLAGLPMLGAWYAARSDSLEAGRKAYVRRDLPLAFRLAQEHLRWRPWSHEAALLGARCLSEMGRPRESEPYYQRARRTGGLSLNDLHLRASAWLVSMDVPRAIDAYQDVLKRAPNDRKALRTLATLNYSIPRFAEAQSYAERLTHIAGGEVVGFALLGSIAHDSWNPQAAVTAYRRVLELDPTLSSLPFSSTQFWSEFGQDLIATGRAAEARERLIGVLAARDDAILHFTRARAEEALGENEAAEASCRRAVDRDPTLGQAWLLLSQLALRKKEPREALEALERARALLKETYESVYTLSQAYRQLGKSEEANRLAKRAGDLRAGPRRADPGVGTEKSPGRAP